MKRLPDGQWINSKRLDACWVEEDEAFLGIGQFKVILNFKSGKAARKWLDEFMERLALDKQVE